MNRQIKLFVWDHTANTSCSIRNSKKTPETHWKTPMLTYWIGAAKLPEISASSLFNWILLHFSLTLCVILQNRWMFPCCRYPTIWFSIATAFYKFLPRTSVDDLQWCWCLFALLTWTSYLSICKRMFLMPYSYHLQVSRSLLTSS